VIGVLLRAFQIRLAPQPTALLVLGLLLDQLAVAAGATLHPAALLAGLFLLLSGSLRLLLLPGALLLLTRLLLPRPLLLTRLLLPRPLLLTGLLLPRPLLLTRLLLTRLLLSGALLLTGLLLSWPLLTRIALLACRGAVHVEVLAVLAELAFLTACATAIQAFLVLVRHGVPPPAKRGRREEVSQAAISRGDALSTCTRASMAALVLPQVIA
jgi:hypothetical protein